jgi:hypothetical protein
MFQLIWLAVEQIYIVNICYSVLLRKLLNPLFITPNDF